MTTAATFWIRLEAEAQARRERERLTREVKVRPQYRAASNDEPEPESDAMRSIREAGDADAQAVMRTVLRASDLNDAEQSK